MFKAQRVTFAVRHALKVEIADENTKEEGCQTSALLILFTSVLKPLL